MGLLLTAWRRLQARRHVPDGLQASLADDLRAFGIIEGSADVNRYERVAQHIIDDVRYRPSISRLQAAESLFVSMDKIGATESSDAATESVIDRIVWRVNSGNLQ